MPDYEVRIEKAKAIPLAVVRRQARREQLSIVVPEGSGDVSKFMKLHNLTGTGRNVAVFLDGKMNLEVGVEFTGTLPEDENVAQSATPAGKVATVTFQGAYDQLGKVHAAIRQWCTDNKKTVAGPNWEIYAHWLPEWNADLSLIQTDVYYLLEG